MIRLMNGFSNEENNDSTSSNSHEYRAASPLQEVSHVSWCRSSDEDAGATGLLDSLLSSLGEELGLDDDGDLGEVALAEDLEIALLE